MSVAEGRDDGGFLGRGRFDLLEGGNLDEAAIDAVAAAEEGVYAVARIDFVSCDEVLGERLNDLAVGESAGCTESLHRPGDPPFLFKRTVWPRKAMIHVEQRTGALHARCMHRHGVAVADAREWGLAGPADCRVRCLGMDRCRC